MGAGRRRITILGATGSIGASTVDVVERHRDAYEIEALTANGNVERLVELARRLRPRYVACGDETHLGALREALAGEGIETGAGRRAVIEAAERPADWVMAAIVGTAGLEPTLAAIRRGAVVAFANKECLVCAGDLMMTEIGRSGATLLPVDSEHNAIFQVFDESRPDSVDRVILTASGGPFRTASRAEMAVATPTDAIRHPTWSMGAKISIDSATMMNKGLELIEAHHLFSLPSSRLEIVVHPQSVVHSLVAYVDGSVLAQLGPPDMRTPIAYTLAWPGRLSTGAARLDLARVGQLTFEPPDPERFPALALARAALEAGGTAPAILNAANEVAVAGFLDRRIGFLDIARVVEATLAEMAVVVPGSLEEVAVIDAEARRRAGRLVGAAAA